MSSPIARRALAALTVPALALSTLAVLAPPAQARADIDPAPAFAGSTWLAAQLGDNGLVHNDQYDFDDIGLSIDVALALEAVGDDASVAKVADAVAANLTSYTSYPVASGKTHVTAGAIAKALELAQSAGRDGKSFGGQDLVAQLEQRVSRDSDTAGRIGDVFFPEEQFEADYANTIGQAYAAETLAEVTSALAPDVLDYLLSQQCAEGFFKLSFATSCDDASAPSVDVTAIALRSLLDITSTDTDLPIAITNAVAWLKKSQAKDGSFGSDGQITAPNANSTGLAGWALGEAGAKGAASDAAVWVRQHQLAVAGSCQTYAAADLGAVAYDDAALSGAADTAIAADTADQFRRASAQSLPALRYAPAASGKVQLPFTAEYVAAGSTQVIVVRKAVPGATLCVKLGKRAVPAVAGGAGGARVRVELPAATGRRTVVVTGQDGRLGTIVINTLGATTFGVAAADRVALGERQRVVVTGLAPAEFVTVEVRGTRVGSGQADGRGRFVTAYPVTGTPGKAKVTVVGGFDNRTGQTTFMVTR